MGRNVLVTTTQYPSVSHVRFRLALQMLREAKIRSFSVLVFDDSPNSVRSKFVSCGEHVSVFPLQKGLSMGEQRRIAFKTALERAGKDGAVVWLEPEKWPLVRWIPLCVAPVRCGDADLVVVGRESMDSYPPNQQHTERVMNHAFGLYLGLQGYDAAFAPRVFNRAAGEHFLAYDGRYGDRWDCIFVPVMTAYAAGLRVGHVTVPFKYPREQAEAETGDPAMDDKRLDQLLSLVGAFREEGRRLKLGLFR